MKRKYYGLAIITLFSGLIIFTIIGVVAYFQWLFSQPLLTTAAVVGILFIPFMAVGLVFWFAFCISGLIAGLEEMMS